MSGRIKLSDPPSIDAYTIPSGEPTTFPVRLSEHPEWHSLVTHFFDDVFFPNMVHLKRTNDVLISHGCAEPLGDRDDAESVLSDQVGDALLEGDFSEEENLENPEEREHDKNIAGYKKNVKHDVTSSSGASVPLQNGSGTISKNPGPRKSSSRPLSAEQTKRLNSLADGQSDLYRRYLEVAGQKVGEKLHWPSNPSVHTAN